MNLNRHPWSTAVLALACGLGLGVAAVAQPLQRPGQTVQAPSAPWPPGNESKAGATLLATNDAVDVQAVLTANSCLGCHAVAKKIVGPAYHDVAAKYRSDPDAVAKVGANIRLGGAGKWGPVPMPSFARLTPAQCKALAEFVLKQ